MGEELLGHGRHLLGRGDGRHEVHQRRHHVVSQLPALGRLLCVCVWCQFRVGSIAERPERTSKTLRTFWSTSFFLFFRSMRRSWA